MLISLITSIAPEEFQDYFVTLYQHYNRYMYTIAYSVVHDDSLAQDAIHDAFVSIIKSGIDLGPVRGAKAKNTIRIIVRNTALKIVNKRANYNEQDLTEELADTIPQPSTGDDLADALFLIKEEFREILLL